MADCKVLVVMGSDSDFPVMEGCFKMLNKFGVGFKATVASAHRTPDKAMTLAIRVDILTKEHNFNNSGIYKAPYFIKNILGIS